MSNNIQHHTTYQIYRQPSNHKKQKKNAVFTVHLKQSTWILGVQSQTGHLKILSKSLEQIRHQAHPWRKRATIVALCAAAAETFDNLSPRLRNQIPSHQRCRWWGTPTNQPLQCHLRFYSCNSSNGIFLESHWKMRKASGLMKFVGRLEGRIRIMEYHGISWIHCGFLTSLGSFSGIFLILLLKKMVAIITPKQTAYKLPLSHAPHLLDFGCVSEVVAKL